MKMISPIFLFIFACSNDSPPDTYTWGEASVELATAYCQTLENCGSVVDQPVCVEHTRFHLCEVDHTCDTDLPPEAPDATMQCVADLLALTPDGEGCYFLQAWGVSPPGCEAIFSFRP